MFPATLRRVPRLVMLCYALLLNNAAPAMAAVDACATLSAPAGVVYQSTPEWIETDELPKYCRVRGVIDQRVNFEMRLPEEWSGRFMMAGCGGFCGALLPDKPGHSNAINEALKRGYAAISHDSGHQAQSWETQWAADPEALELWAHKVLPVVAGAGTELAIAFYGQEPRYKYFSGCSNGGRLGMMAAQRYPGLFDGIAAGASIFDLSGLAGLWGNWLIANNQAGPDSRFPQAKVPLIEQIVMKQCDRLDGLSDGIIDDPRICKLDFSVAACPAGSAQQDNCLTGKEAALLNTLYGGVRNSAGEVVYPSAALGSEHYADRWLFGSAGKPAWGVLASTGYRQMLAADLSVDDSPAGLTTDQMLDWISRSSIPALTDAKNTDLGGLRKDDTKLLIYQGWSDPLIIPEPITRYYQQAADRQGGLAQLQHNARLFMVPGWGHCWEKPASAPDDFDPLLELEQWVEAGRAPEFIVARQRGTDGAVQRSRPICAFPSIARLKAGHNPDDYRSYECVDDSASPAGSAP
jgi:pimeloyl-ACP methyl ester carboxylesterase